MVKEEERCKKIHHRSQEEIDTCVKRLNRIAGQIKGISKMIEEYGKTLENIPQANYTTYKLSGKIKKVIYPSDAYKLKKLLEYLNKDNIKYKVIGNGSNIIFDGDYDGVIIKLDNLNSLSIDDDIVKVGAGYNLMKLALKTVDNSLSGLEFASGIPGTVGGAIYMNAGA